MGRIIRITSYRDGGEILAGPWTHTLKTDNRSEVREGIESWAKHMGHTVKVQDHLTGQILADMIKGDEPYVYQFKSDKEA